jgi:hypothetical protein
VTSGATLEGWEMVRSPTMEKTRAEGEQAMLLRVLHARTKQEAPQDLATKIQATIDRARLQAWGDIAATVDSIDAFRQQTGL